jgi:hypothetical protein
MLSVPHPRRRRRVQFRWTLAGAVLRHERADDLVQLRKRVRTHSPAISMPLARFVEDLAMLGTKLQSPSRGVRKMTRSTTRTTKREGKKTAQGKTSANLLVAMTGKASAAKAAEGDEPVFAYIASLPQPQRGIAERIDALAARTLPNLRRAVKWGMAYYGVDGGWCFSSGAFVGHVKVMFIRGTEIRPEPPVTPTGMGKSTRGVELASVDDLDKRQLALWMEQAACIPFVGAKKR